MSGYTASLSHMPTHHGDGYGWGGDCILTIGEQSLNLGLGREAVDMARRIVALWNAADELGLTTEAIEAGVIQRLRVALINMLDDGDATDQRAAAELLAEIMGNRP